MDNGAIAARVITRRQMEGDRPSSLEESGADREVYDRLRNRGHDYYMFETKGFLGGAVAWLLKTSNLCWLEDRLMERVERHNGGKLPPVAYAALVRNAGAPTIQFCAEPAGGMPEDPEVDWLFDLLDEGLELGVYNDAGYAGFLLPHGYEQYQEALDDKQAEWWNIVRPGITMAARAQVEFVPVGNDVLDEEPGIIVPCFTAGEFSFIKTATLRLEGKWKLADLECRPTIAGWQALNRKVVGITPREGKSPMLWQFAREGGLDECGPHFPLSGSEVIRSVLSHLSIPLLGSRGLNWLKYQA